ncbi:Hypothetical protein R9X50_00585700 [Acrodontium crateriforme]|uniref:PH domain-containing protein n=1 Tax=Acrodontium crateriforme TaxID=150365 RepID=A0AAQ3RBU6_9PEZI|nr:Hypothetical protein R9X50_00585700 [Acrodontium crateriforme]
MATTASQPLGAAAANDLADPFTSSSPKPGDDRVRYAGFDNEQFSLYSTSSPGHAKRALEAHLKDTDRRIQDASRLGSTLVQQRKDLAARLKDIELVQSENEVPDDLRKKLTELEREYNEVGKESARAFLPKSRVADAPGGPNVLSASGRESPTKVTAPSRRQRNQPNNRVHDIEFATEISTSLLAQVRQLQAALAEKDDALNDTVAAKAHLEADITGLTQRIKRLDESEQRYKDENWNLETRLQELEASHKAVSDKEERLNQTLKSTQFEKAAAQRDLDTLKLSHEKLNEEHTLVKKQHESELHGLRREATGHQTDKSTLQKKVEELTAQNTELAKAVSQRWKTESRHSDTEFHTAEEDEEDDDYLPDHSEPTSPIKNTPRHGFLESETLKSSLGHAHRMIQNLKNNIHREKTEKLELKRMLQDARDELETRRGNNVTANVAKKRRSDQDSTKFKKPGRADLLGASRSSTTEILEDEPDWEDEDGERTPSRSRFLDRPSLHHADTESSDAFETATERDHPTETEAFETGHEQMSDGDEDLTETESGFHSSSAVRKTISPRSAGDRTSFVSTASTSADEEDDIVKTPAQPKYKLRVARGGRRGGDRVNSIINDSPISYSPTSSTGTPHHGQTLGDELDALDEGSVNGTPSSYAGTPATQRLASVDPDTPSSIIRPVTSEGDDTEIASPTIIAFSPGPPLDHAGISQVMQEKPAMVDAGIMTEPWEPEQELASEKQSIRSRAGEVVGGALAGFGLGRIIGNKENGEETVDSAHDKDLAHEPQPEAPVVEKPVTLQHSQIVSLDTEPVAKKVEPIVLEKSMIFSQETEPIVPPAPEPAPAPVAIPVSKTEYKDASTTPATPVKRAYTNSSAGLDAALPLGAAAVVAAGAGAVAGGTLAAAKVKKPEQKLGFSVIETQHLEPILPSPVALVQRPIVPKRSSKRLAQAYAADASDEPMPEENDDDVYVAPVKNKRPYGAFFTGPIPIPPSKEDIDGSNREFAANGRDSPTLASGEKGPIGDDSLQSRASLGELPLNFMREQRRPSSKKNVATPEVTKISRTTVDGNSQTVVTGDEIENLLQARRRASTVTGTSNSTAQTITPGQTSLEGMTAAEIAANKAVKRSVSSGNMRNDPPVVSPPPLPKDHNVKIAQAQKAPASSIVGSAMGPPLVPASAYKKSTRSKAPVDQGNDRLVSANNVASASAKVRDPRSQIQSPVSRRTSVSSFASELDERFNIMRGNLMLPDDVAPSTDPRMIQAITQTMIGEYLWKYTRKAGRSEKSSTRHKRFFWVHPYTRTLYWSEQDPSTAGRDMLKAKSVAIESVRVITDDNAYPPGLHRKSLVVVTPGRDIIFTAPTGQRHETWFNALSYLLLRTGDEREAEDTVNQDDIDEFHPSFLRKSLGKMTGRDRSNTRASLSSYNSRTTRQSSPQRNGGVPQQRPTLTLTNRDLMSPPPLPASTASRTPTARGFGSIASRFRSATGGRSQPGSATRRTPGSINTRSGRMIGDPAEIYDASVVPDSTEDLRVLIERQEREADRLENVRACCDGKHDVGSLSHKNGRSSLGGRFSHQHINHSHSHPRSETLKGQR